ncbi:MAG: O-antigen ligase family protein [Moorea sp. SIO2B7]|nr:O-antigen ligase family protein [Moorena sp. SIO2B7]
MEKGSLYSHKRTFYLAISSTCFCILFLSFNPRETIQVSIYLTATTLFGLYIATRYSLEEQIDLLVWMYGIVIILSIIFAVLPPRYGIESGVHLGAFRGIYTHKNIFGRIMIPGAILFLLRAMSAKKDKLILWTAVIVSVIMLVLCRSTTALINYLMMLSTFFIYRTFRWRYEVMVPSILGIATIGGSFLIWLAENAETLLKSVGKDATLSGRTDFWPFLWEMIYKRPQLGYGFGAFWNPNPYGGGPNTYIVRAAGWEVPSAHNGFIELLLTLGIVGFSMYVIGFTINLIKAIRFTRNSYTIESLWPLLFLTYNILANISESGLFEQNSIFWVLYTTICFSFVSLPRKYSRT